MQTFLSRPSRRYGAQRASSKLLCGIATAVFTFAAGFSVADAETMRVTALGDSLTQGYGLLPDEGLVPQLQAWLLARGHDVAILNAGVSGDTTAGGLSRLDWTLADRPDAMIVALGGNDLLRGIDPAISRANLAGILGGLQAAGIPALLVGLPAPGNYGPEYQAAFSAMYPELAAEFDVLLVTDMLAPLSLQSIDGQPAARYFQNDGIHPNADGVARIVDGMGPQVEALITQASAADGA